MSELEPISPAGVPVERVIIDLKEEMRAAGVVDRYVGPRNASWRSQ